MCTITDSEIKADGQTIGTALESIAALEQATNPTLAANLVTAANTLIEVTSTWTSGSSVALFNDAANAVEAVLADIPQTAAYAPFVAIAVAALDILIANIGQPPAPVSVVSVRATMDRIDALPPNPWRGKAEIIHYHGKSLLDDFVSAWDAEVDKQPKLGIRKIRHALFS
jgi:hypothetical protein